MPDNVLQGQKLVWLPIIMGVSIVLSAIIASVTFYKVRALDNNLQVSGSAKKAVTSDIAKWTSYFSRVALASDLKSGYVQMAADAARVKKFFIDHGITETDLVLSPVFMDQNYYPDQGSRPKDYTLRQTVELQSHDVAKVTELAKNTQDLIGQGVLFATQSLEYYYSKLPEVRIELLSAALQDAKARATKIAESSGSSVGPLKAASIGVVQVLPVNSTDVSDYGSYDTSKIEKEVMVTVKASFRIN